MANVKQKLKRLRMTVTLSKVGTTTLDREKRLDVLIPMPEPDKLGSPAEYAKIWDNFREWGAEEDESDKNNPNTVIWIDSRPKLDEIFNEGLRAIARKRGNKRLTEMARQELGKSTKKGRGISAYSYE